MALAGVHDATGRELASLIDADTELAAAVPEGERTAARRMTVGLLIRLPAGPLRDLDLERVSALYVVEGVLLREVTVSDAGMPEALGPGDLLRPRTAFAGPEMGAAAALHAMRPTTLLAVGDRLREAAWRWPALAAQIEQRWAARHDRAMLAGAIGHLPRVEQRVLAMLWLLAHQWGRVVPEGVLVPFPMTHEMLGRFVGAARPTVTLALRALAETDMVARRPDGRWVLPLGSEPWAEDGETLSGPAADLLRRARLARERSRVSREEIHVPADVRAASAEETAAVLAQAAQARRRVQQRRGG